MFRNRTRGSAVGSVVRQRGSVVFAAALFVITFSGVGLHYAMSTGGSASAAVQPSAGVSPAAVGTGWGAPALHYATYAPPVVVGAGHIGVATGASAAGTTTAWSSGAGPIGVPGPGSMLMHCAKMTRLQALSSSQG